MRVQSAHGRLVNENETGYHGYEWFDQSFTNLYPCGILKNGQFVSLPALVLLPSTVFFLCTMDEALAEFRRLLKIIGPLSLRLQAQQQAALHLMHARRLGATDEELRRVVDAVVLDALASVARR